MKPGNQIGDLIGNTPLVRINHVDIPEQVKLFGKLEGNNPGGSVKDRPAFNMISEALKRGDITTQTRLVEATSGNTGIALAMVAAGFKLDITLVMPENSTKERVDTMKAYGASVILTPSKGTIEYSREVAEGMVSEGYFMLNQFSNKDNFQSHYKSTSPEIWEDTNGEITHFVSSMGTTGTIMGCSMHLKEQNDSIQIIGVQPTEGSQIPGIRKWSPEFLPAIYDETRVDEIRYVNRTDAEKMTLNLARTQGIFAGISSGGAMKVALDLARNLKDNATIVSIICDRGDRYLSEDLFG